MKKTFSTPTIVDNTEYKKSLTVDESVIFDLYDQIAKNNDQVKLCRMVEEGTLLPDSVSKENQTPLMIAIDNNFSLETVKKLVELGCDVNASDSDGNTPLHTAAWTENIQIFEYLISSGADPLKPDNDGLDVKALCTEQGLKEF